MKARYLGFVFLLLFLVLWLASLNYANVIVTSRDGALAALGQIQEWTKWMTGIQTAGLALLVYLVFVKDSVQVRQLPTIVWFFILTTFIFLGSALLCNSWIFSSLSSHSIRVYSVVLEPGAALSPEFDVYETPAFGWTPWITLGYLLSVAHWLWVVGLVSLGLAFGRIVLDSNTSK